MKTIIKLGIKMINGKYSIPLGFGLYKLTFRKISMMNNGNILINNDQTIK